MKLIPIISYFKLMLIKIIVPRFRGFLKERVGVFMAVFSVIIVF